MKLKGPKSLKIDLASKPVSTAEDQAVMNKLFTDKIILEKIQMKTYQSILQNYVTEMLSSDPVAVVAHSIIPESPSRRSRDVRHDFQGISLMSPRTILSPSFAATPTLDFNMPAPTTTSPLVRPPSAVTTSRGHSNQLVFPHAETIKEELDVLLKVAATNPDGITIHTSQKHPLFQASQILSKRGRPTYEADEELRTVNEIIFEGVFGLPGFLSWTAYPLALARYQNVISVADMAEQLTCYGEAVQEIFSPTSKKYIMTTETLLKWYNDDIKGRTINERLFNVLQVPGAGRVTNVDIQRIAQVLIKLHPGLAFLADTPQFQNLYAETVGMRVLLENDSNFKGYLDLRDFKKIQNEYGTSFTPDRSEMKRGGFLESLWQSQYEQDINKNLKCFSYEHFYVFYVTFWELDTDRDKILRQGDLERYLSESVSKLAVERAFDLLIQIRLKTPQLYLKTFKELLEREPANNAELMEFLSMRQLYYIDFMRYLIFLENPDLDASVDFWFNVLDLDADGNISYDDFKPFYAQLKEKVELQGTEVVDASDVFCQILDYYKALASYKKGDGVISMQNVRQSKARANIFSVMTHFYRFSQWDMKDPYQFRASQVERSNWERFCRYLYDVQVQGISGEGGY